MANNRKLGRPTDHRMAMLRAMVTYLLENGRIETTLARAKEVGPLTEKMITLGKKNTLASRRQAMAFVTKEAVVAKLFSEIAPEYAKPQRRLHPHHQDRPAPRRRSGNGDHRAGQVRRLTCYRKMTQKGYPVACLLDSLFLCALRIAAGTVRCAAERCADSGVQQPMLTSAQHRLTWRPAGLFRQDMLS